MDLGFQKSFTVSKYFQNLHPDFHFWRERQTCLDFSPDSSPDPSKTSCGPFPMLRPSSRPSSSFMPWCTEQRICRFGFSSLGNFFMKLRHSVFIGHYLESQGTTRGVILNQLVTRSSPSTLAPSEGHSSKVVYEVCSALGIHFNGFEPPIVS